MIHTTLQVALAKALDDANCKLKFLGLSSNIMGTGGLKALMQVSETLPVPLSARHSLHASHCCVGSLAHHHRDFDSIQLRGS